MPGFRNPAGNESPVSARNLGRALVRGQSWILEIWFTMAFLGLNTFLCLHLGLKFGEFILNRTTRLCCVKLLADAIGLR